MVLAPKLILSVLEMDVLGDLGIQAQVGKRVSERLLDLGTISLAALPSGR